jgi:hypothetical protein
MARGSSRLLFLTVMQLTRRRLSGGVLLTSSLPRHDLELAFSGLCAVVSWGMRMSSCINRVRLRLNAAFFLLNSQCVTLVVFFYYRYVRKRRCYLSQRFPSRLAK